MKNQQISIGLKIETIDELNRLSKHYGISRSKIAAELLAYSINLHERSPTGHHEGMTLQYTLRQNTKVKSDG